MASSKKDTKPKAGSQKAPGRASTAERDVDPKAASTPAKISAPAAGFRLFEWKPGNYSLTLRGPGYAWERVARKLARGAGLLDRLQFDPEASVFSAFSTDREALQALQALLDPLLEDEEKLRALERSARVDGDD
ncbi:MAG: Imm51 family immunity protein [Byssovorax sp.]